MTPNTEKILFLAASSLADEEERKVLLDQACRDDPVLRRRIEELFELQDAATDYFAPLEVRESGEDATKTEEGLGTRIGRYRLIKRIGAGGCGVVYLAEQCEPVQRKVALKIIRLGMDTERVIARFEAERQSLALMEHSNIARVLDAGATASGRPYFVMELVDGEKITDFCDNHRLEVRQRLELFVLVCLAIQHAHQKGVIHRDIKPSNILVRIHDDVPTPKVIDFGIAKAAASNTDDDNVNLTRLDQFLGTPAYMSPEMAAGSLDLDTRSDIHSLGVILYELLTGSTPFGSEHLQTLGIEEIRRIVREVDPPAPSSRLVSLGSAELADITARRSLDGPKLAQILKGDLDWIVMKAIDRDQDRRYETAYGLALDVQRYLRNEPVSAGRPGISYRMAKFIGRNKVPLLFGTLAVLTLVVGFGTSTVLFFKEKAARHEQEELRERAEFREMVAQAAVQISHDDYEMAAQLLAGIPFGQVPASLEAAQSYSKVGEWHLLAGRWQDATDCFASAALVLTSADPSDSYTISFTLIPAASLLCQSEDFEHYEVIRKAAVERFSDTKSPVVAEQVLKASLLLPTDRKALTALQPLADFLEHAITQGHKELSDSVGSHRIAWSCFAIALMKYREGDFSSASEWAGRCLSLGAGNPSREAGIRSIMAMIAYKRGNELQARALLDTIRPRIELVFSKQMRLGDLNSFWFDWVITRILLQEAENMMTESSIGSKENCHFLYFICRVSADDGAFRINTYETPTTFPSLRSSKKSSPHTEYSGNQRDRPLVRPRS